MTIDEIFFKIAELGIAALSVFLMYRVTMKALDTKKGVIVEG